MRFESQEDLEREELAIKTFVSLFDGSYQKLRPTDIDFRVLDKNGKTIAYVEIKGRSILLDDNKPLCVSASKLVKLSAKRLNPIIIWACPDGIIYSKVTKLVGALRWGGREKRAGSYNDEELMVYFSRRKNFKTIYYF